MNNKDKEKDTDTKIYQDRFHQHLRVAITVPCAAELGDTGVERWEPLHAVNSQRKISID